MATYSNNTTFKISGKVVLTSGSYTVPANCFLECIVHTYGHGSMSVDGAFSINTNLNEPINCTFGPGTVLTLSSGDIVMGTLFINA